MFYEKREWFGGWRRAVGWGVVGLVAVAVADGPAAGVGVMIAPIGVGQCGKCYCGKFE